VPKTWRGIGRKRGRFDVLVNDVMASFMNAGIKPNKRQICEKLGLDYENIYNRDRVTMSIHNNRTCVHDAWNLWIETGDFDRHYQAVADDSVGYRRWKEEENPSLYQTMKKFGMLESAIHKSWVLYKLWEKFLAVANLWNLHAFVAEGTPWTRGGFAYHQPNYWDYIANQVRSARKLCKGTLMILERHRDMEMFLMSGTEIEVAVQTAKDMLQMIEDGAPPRFRCEMCAGEGIMRTFKTQQELVTHYYAMHNIS
jgi:hypothetical protein